LCFVLQYEKEFPSERRVGSVSRGKAKLRVPSPQCGLSQGVWEKLDGYIGQIWIYHMFCGELRCFK
jgi:hypothetical protein